MLSNEKNFTALVQQNRSLAQKVRDFFADFVEKIKNALARLAKSNPEYSALQNDFEAQQKVLQMFDEALEQSNNNATANKNRISYSKKLGEFADVSINSADELDYYGIKNTTNSLNDYVGIQKRIINTLKDDNFFNINNRNIVVNADTDIVVEIGPEGIRETFSKGNRYEILPRKIKTAKVATIRSLPNLIKYAEVVELHQPNYHNKKNVDFLVLQHPVTVDNDNFNIEIKIKRSLEKNKFYIHNLTIKNEMSGAFGKGVNIVNKSMPLISGAQSRSVNLSQKLENVNAISTQDEKVKLSLKENIKDIEEFDETGYNIINTTGKKGYSKLKSEVMTWDGDRYLDEIRLIRIDDRFYIYKMLSDDTRDVIIYKPRSNQAKELYKEMRGNYVVRNYRRPVDVIEIVRIKYGHGNGDNVLFRRQRGESKSDDKLHNSPLRGKGNSNGRRTSENDHNDNLPKG